MKTILVSPLDVIFFRDGRSFSAGVDHEAQTLFPPLPSTFYGAIRSAILSQKGAQFTNSGFTIDNETAQNEVGSPSKFGSLQVKFFSLAKFTSDNAEPLFSMPTDILKKKKSELPDYKVVSPTAFKPSIQANFPLPSIQFLWSVHPEDEFYESAEGFLSLNGFEKYLKGETPNHNHIIPSREVYQKEPRTAIRLKKTKITGEGQLFSVDFVRMASNTGFLLTLAQSTSLSDKGFLRLGGEAKAAIYRTLKPISIDTTEIQKKVKESKRFKIVLMTPAVFQKGWIPDGIDDTTGEGTVFGCHVKLIGASLGRYIIVGGWDLAKNCPKPAWRAIPAGSVYFFEILDGEPDALCASFGESILSADWAKQGFGLSFIGAIS